MNDIEIEDFVRNVYDFPKKGVVFKDITPLLRNPQITQKVLQQLIEPLKGLKIDKVAGIESRGFLFGMLLAQALQVGFNGIICATVSHFQQSPSLAVYVAHELGLSAGPVAFDISAACAGFCHGISIAESLKIGRAHV